MTWCRPVACGARAYREPIAAWRRYAGQMRALLSIGGRLHDGKPGRLEATRPGRERRRIEELLAGRPAA